MQASKGQSSQPAAPMRRSRLRGPGLYTLGPAAGLDGDRTVFDSQPYVSRVRGTLAQYFVDHTFDYDAIFLAWTQNQDWWTARFRPTCMAVASSRLREADGVLAHIWRSTQSL
jgi:hypothetical protein